MKCIKCAVAWTNARRKNVLQHIHIGSRLLPGVVFSWSFVECCGVSDVTKCFHLLEHCIDVQLFRLRPQTRTVGQMWSVNLPMDRCSHSEMNYIYIWYIYIYIYHIYNIYDLSIKMFQTLKNIGHQSSCHRTIIPSSLIGDARGLAVCRSVWSPRMRCDHNGMIFWGFTGSLYR